MDQGKSPAIGSVSSYARAKPDYILAPGALASWSTTFKATPYLVAPAAVTFTDKDGTNEDTYTVPATTGIDYLVGGKVVAAGKYPGHRQGHGNSAGENRLRPGSWCLGIMVDDV